MAITLACYFVGILVMLSLMASWIVGKESELWGLAMCSTSLLATFQQDGKLTVVFLAGAQF